MDWTVFTTLLKTTDSELFLFKRTSMHIFLTNLALSDLLVLIFCLPPTVINDITKTFWFSAGFCKAILFFQVVHSLSIHQGRSLKFSKIKKKISRRTGQL